MNKSANLIHIEDLHISKNVILFKSYITFLKDLYNNPFKYLKDQTLINRTSTIASIARSLIQNTIDTIFYFYIYPKTESNRRLVIISKDYVSISRSYPSKRTPIRKINTPKFLKYLGLLIKSIFPQKRP